MLGDQGADVLKVESPEGDGTRRWGLPFAHGQHGKSAYFVGLNRNKSVVVLDLASNGGRAQFPALLEEADVLIEHLKPSTLAR